MRNFFHGWRRKAGVLALALGLMFAGCWVKSFSGLGTVSLDFPSQQKVASLRGTILWWSVEKPGDLNPEFLWWETNIDAPPMWIGIEVIEIPEVGSVRKIRYWLVVVPLILLSAYFLLSPQTETGKASIASRMISFFQTDPKRRKRLVWSPICAVIGSGVCLGLPMLLRISGVPVSSSQNLGHMFYLTALLWATIFSGLAGFIAGLIRPGRPAIVLTLVCIILLDIAFLGYLTYGNVNNFRLVLSVSAAVKVILIILIAATIPKPFKLHSPPSDGAAHSN